MSWLNVVTVNFNKLVLIEINAKLLLLGVLKFFTYC